MFSNRRGREGNSVWNPAISIKGRSDIDGVLYVGKDVIPGAVETIALSKQCGLRMRFITRTRSNPKAACMPGCYQTGF